VGSVTHGGDRGWGQVMSWELVGDDVGGDVKVRERIVELGKGSVYDVRGEAKTTTTTHSSRLESSTAVSKWLVPPSPSC